MALEEIDLPKANEAYLKSAGLGHHFSQNNLALLYQEHPAARLLRVELNRVVDGLGLSVSVYAEGIEGAV